MRIHKQTKRGRFGSAARARETQAKTPSKSKRENCGATESNGKLGENATEDSRIYLKRYSKSGIETGTRTRRGLKKGGFRKMADRMRRRDRVKPR